jgi:hypothetical protein
MTTPPKEPELTAAPSDHDVADTKLVAPALALPPSAEDNVIKALELGLDADFDEWQEAQGHPVPDLAQQAEWSEARTLRGEFIVELCTSVRKGTRSFPRGIQIKGARITKGIDLNTASIDALLVLERCRIEGDVKLRDCSARLINLAGSRVCGDVSGDRVRASAGVYLRYGFTCEGAVRLTSAVIDGDLDCTDATILNDQARRQAREDRKRRAREKAKLPPPAREPNYALRCDRVRVKGSVFLRGLDAAGQVRLPDAEVGGNVELKDATLDATDGNAGPADDARSRDSALFADNARIVGSLVLRDWKQQPVGMLSVRNATAGVLQLGKYADTWPAPATVRAQGFRFGTIETDGLVSQELCQRWLDLLVLDPFTSQPYEKCAQVLRENGLSDEAKEISIRRRRDQRDAKPTPMSGWRRRMDILFDKAIGYGYRPGRSVGYLAMIALIGTIVFGVAQASGAMIPADNALAKVYRTHPDSIPPGYPPLVAPVYSLDVLLPIIDFQQDSKWRPDRRVALFVNDTPIVPIGWIALVWSWFQIALGWVLSTLLVGSVTGLIRKE